MSRSDDDLAERAKARVGALLCGKYRIESVLGVGGMATVYAATHRNGHRVALKVLHTELSVNSHVRARFRREGQAANGVKHPGAVVVIDDDVAEDGAAFLVMELLDGQSVEELWEHNGQRLPPKTVLAIARELCDVLAAAHRVGTVHRDIKPANLFVARDGRVKVLDFGIARIRDAAAPTGTESGIVFGTPTFMAPEQAMGRATQIDGQTDLWAVGATMFTLLSGALVHEGETAQHLAVLAATKPARSLATVAPDVDPRLVAVVDRALAFEKKDRWPTAEAMGEALATVSMALFGTTNLALTSLSDTLVAHAPQRIAEKSGTLASPGEKARVRLVVGATDEPVSSTGSTHPEHARRGLTRKTRVIGAVAVAVVFLLPLGVVVALRNARHSPVIATEPVAPRSTPAASTSATLSEPTPPSASSPAPSVAPRSAESTPPRAPLVTRSKPAARPAVQAPAPLTSSTPAPAASAPSSRCAEPFVMSADGKKLWKPECL
jgi:serine/threonine-protein kinase